MKNNIYLIQPNFMYGSNAYLPYSIAAIAAYAFNDPIISGEYALKGLQYKREEIEKVVAKMVEPCVIGFSNYIWNFEYNKVLAKRLKEEYSNCYIIFGGHNIASDNADLLRECAFIDFLIHDEGEIPFKELLLELNGAQKFGKINNISYRNVEEVIKTTSKMVSETNYPSPYLTGIFDEILKDEDVNFTATLETNRGCPFKCAYCDWGVYKSQLRAFPEEKIKEEIKWMAEKKIDFCMGADSNFGVLDRDVNITNWLVESNLRTGFPQKFRVAYTKNSDDVVFEINKKLNKNGMCKGATLSFQSLNVDVLRTIERVNITIPKFKELMTKYNKEDIPTYSEIILGLPGETYESFCKGINCLIENGQHTSINIYNCELLVNSKMGSAAFIKKYGIKAVTTPLNQYHCEINSNDIKEFSKVVIGTNTMNESEWIKANCFGWAVQCFHCLGLLQYIAIYFNNESILSYDQFYNELIDWIEARKFGLIQNIFSKIKTQLEKITKGVGEWEYINPIFGNLTWPFEEGAYLEYVYKSDEFYEEIRNFLKGYDIEEIVLLDLLEYQKCIINIPFKSKRNFEFKYDFFNYFKGIKEGEQKELEKKQNKIIINDYFKGASWAKYAEEIIWYGRKGGKNFCTKIEQV